MGYVLVDSCVLIDILAGGLWQAWSSHALGHLDGRPAIDMTIAAEVSGSYEHLEDFLQAVPPSVFPTLEIPIEAAFLAGHAHRRYRHQGGSRKRTLPDFMIGAHAAVRGTPLLTRDPRRYRRYFPRLKLIAPDEHYQAWAPQT